MISFELAPEQEKIRDQVREFAQKEITPRVTEIDEKDEIPQDLLEKLRKPPHSFTAIGIPKKYGGRGLDSVSILVVTEEIGYASPVCCTLIEVAEVGTRTILLAGNEEQKDKYVSAVARGDMFPAFAMTEPGAGSDAAGIVTRAEKVSDGYVIQGRKRYVSHAGSADYFAVSTKIGSAKEVKGVTLFLVGRGTPGLSLGEPLKTMGLKGHKAYSLIFEQCKVPQGNLLGEEGRGLRYLLAALDETRLSLAGGFIGLARACLEQAVKFATSRNTFGMPIAEYQAIRFPVTEIALEIEAARLLAYKAAWLSDKGEKHTKETSMAKLYAGEVMIRASSVAASTLGGYGVTSETPVERYYRDARTWLDAQGTMEMQKLIISRRIFA